MGCLWQCLIDFRIYLQMETSQPLWVTCSSVWPPTQYKKCFILFRFNFTCFSVCPLPLVLAVDTTDESLAHSSSFPLIRCIYMHWDIYIDIFWDIYMYALIKFFLSLVVKQWYQAFCFHIKGMKNVSYEACWCEPDLGLIYAYPLVSTETRILYLWRELGIFFCKGFSQLEDCLAGIKRYQDFMWDGNQLLSSCILSIGPWYIYGVSVHRES